MRTSHPYRKVILAVIAMTAVSMFAFVSPRAAMSPNTPVQEEAEWAMQLLGGEEVVAELPPRNPDLRTVVSPLKQEVSLSKIERGAALIYEFFQ